MPHSGRVKIKVFIDMLQFRDIDCVHAREGQGAFNAFQPREIEMEVFAIVLDGDGSNPRAESIGCDFQEREAKAGKLLVGGDFDNGGLGKVKP